MTTPLDDLAVRCEQAAGPDRELDIAIATGAAGWTYQPHVRHNFKWHDGQFDVPGPPPRFTASLDAAMLLVAEGWPSLCVGTTDDGRGYANLAGNDAHMMAQDPDEFWVEGDAATPALALCAAALRSLSREKS